MSLCKFCQKEADITPSFCLHSCVCSECFYGNSISCCPECSYPIYNYKSSKYTLKETIDTFVAPSNPDKTRQFVAAVAMLLRSMQSYDTQTIKKLAGNLQTLVRDIGEEEGKCVLDKTQCEFLLDICLKKIHTTSVYMLQNFFVALCKYPWEISTRLGGSGVCYYGNFGDTPSIIGAVALVRRNINSIKTQNNFFV